MEQKYIYSFSQIEDKVKALHETNTEAAAAVALSWLGLSRDELKTLRVSDYNSTMRMLHSADRVVYVREDLIADMLKAICEEAPEYSMGFFITDVNSAYESAEKQELSPIFFQVRPFRIRRIAFPYQLRFRQLSAVSL